MSTTAEDAADLAGRLARIKALCERLLSEQADGADARQLAERIAAAVEATRAALKLPTP